MEDLFCFASYREDCLVDTVPLISIAWPGIETGDTVWRTTGMQRADEGRRGREQEGEEEGRKQEQKGPEEVGREMRSDAEG